MIKTQIQMPEDLYNDLKRLAHRKEWSLAETLRRGGEQILELYPLDFEKKNEWQPPTSRHLGWKGLDTEEIHGLVLDEMEARLP